MSHAARSALPVLGLACALLTPAARTQPPTAWPDVPALGATFAEHGMGDAYDALCDRLGRAGERYGAAHTPTASVALMADPLGASARAVAWTDRVLAAGRATAADLADLLRQAAELRDLEAPPALADDFSDIDGLDARLDAAAALLAEAGLEIEAALAAVPVERRRALHDEALAMLRSFVKTVYVTSQERHDRAWDELVRHVDQAALLRAATLLAPLFDAAFWTPAIREARQHRDEDLAVDGVGGRLVAVRETPLGLIVVGDRFRNTYDGTARIALLVDVGGDDEYAAGCSHARHHRPLAVVVDLSGDDRHGAPAGDDPDRYGGPASALLGVGGVLDLRGDDTWHGASLSCGAACLGVAVLIDVAGDDTYTADAYAQGAAVFGTALWLDLAGADELTGHLFAQGFAGPLGYGLLLDVAGADRRTATGKYPSSYGTAGEYRAMSQGAAVGWRRLRGDGAQLAGGFGLLVDGGGDDVSNVGEFGYGMGYFLGTGIVRDAGGDDRVDASRYGIATGAHQACGIVLDDAGDDVYVNPHTASIAGNWDGTVSVLVDAAGDDRYHGAGITTGSSTIDSFAALVDAGGRDTYQSRGGRTAFASCGHRDDVRRGSRCVALFADLGGARDEYPAQSPLQPPPANDLITVYKKSDEHDGQRGTSGSGLFVDR